MGTIAANPNLLAHLQAAIAQLGERQTEDLKVPSSILGLGIAHVCVVDMDVPHDYMPWA